MTNNVKFKLIANTQSVTKSESEFLVKGSKTTP